LKSLTLEGGRLDGPDGATPTICHTPRFVTEDMVALRLAALRGVAVCQFPTFVVQDDIRAGRLIDLLPGWAPRAGSFTPPFHPGEECYRQYERSAIFSQRSMRRLNDSMAGNRSRWHCCVFFSLASAVVGK
jgi:DNA-binding transcriptional LysR family regulator